MAYNNSEIQQMAEKQLLVETKKPGLEGFVAGGKLMRYVGFELGRIGRDISTQKALIHRLKVALDVHLDQ